MSLLSNLDWRHWVLTHIVWIVLATATVIGFNSWRSEHDARLIAQQTIKTSEAQVSLLQKQIADRDAQAVQQAAPIVKIIHDVQTVPQAVAALPQVVNQPLPEPVVRQPDNSVLIPQPDVIPLFQQVADDKICRIQVNALIGDVADQKAIVKQKDGEVAALKKPKSFWRRTGGVLKLVGIGIGIGVTIARL
jgi:hypothetical protein